MNNNEKHALIGYTGFVGGTISKQHQFDAEYNSRNIDDIEGAEFDLVVCAGAPGVKWLANQEPDKDLANITKLQKSLSSIKSTKFVLISTVDVFNNPVKVNEGTAINLSELSPYGKHRRMLEEFVEAHFDDVTIVRLPGLFGAGLKKNLIYDLINRQRYDTFNPESEFQFYNMERLWSDIELSAAHKLPLIHLAVEPVSAFEVAEVVHEGKLLTNRELPIVKYDFQTMHANVFNGVDGYIESKAEYLPSIGKLIASERVLL
jgi:nucleoside-diphosphate-sugar epimerase